MCIKHPFNVSCIIAIIVVINCYYKCQLLFTPEIFGPVELEEKPEYVVFSSAEMHAVGSYCKLYRGKKNELSNSGSIQFM